MSAEDAVEDFVDAAELAVEVENVLEFPGVQIFRDARVLGDTVTEAGFRFPGGHGVFLDGLVGFIARHSLFNQILEELAGEDEALGGIEVAEHALGEDAHLADDGGHFVEHVVDENGGIREDDALNGGMGDVALVPEGDIFIGGDHVAANEASEAADLFTGDGVALVRHGGAAALLAAEMFLGFANLGALEVADFESDLLEGGGDESKGREVVGVAVA